jgi:hypothetical protein
VSAYADAIRAEVAERTASLIAYHERTRDELMAAGAKYLDDIPIHDRERLHHIPHGSALQFMTGSPAVVTTAKQRRIAKRVAANMKPRMGGLWFWLPRWEESPFRVVYRGEWRQ